MELFSVYVLVKMAPRKDTQLNKFYKSDFISNRRCSVASRLENMGISEFSPGNI